MAGQEPSNDKVLSGAIKAAAQVRTAVAEMRDKRGALDAERMQLKARISFIYALPVRREDALQCMLDSIDQVAAGFPKRTHWGRVFEKFAFPQRGYSPENSLTHPSQRRRPMSLMDIEDASRQGGGMQTVFSLGFETLYTGKQTAWAPWDVDALYFFFGDAIKGKVKLHFDELFPDYTNPKFRPDHRLREQDSASYVDATPQELQTTAEERRAEINRLSTRLSEVADQIEAIDENIAELQSSISI